MVKYLINTIITLLSIEISRIPHICMNMWCEWGRICQRQWIPTLGKTPRKLCYFLQKLGKIFSKCQFLLKSVDHQSLKSVDHQSIFGENYIIFSDFSQCSYPSLFILLFFVCTLGRNPRKMCHFLQNLFFFSKWEFSNFG